MVFSRKNECIFYFEYVCIYLLYVIDCSYDMLTSGVDVMPLTMFRSEGSSSNGDLRSTKDISFSEPAVSLVCHARDTSVLFTGLICD